MSGFDEAEIMQIYTAETALLGEKYEKFIIGSRIRLPDLTELTGKNSVLQEEKVDDEIMYVIKHDDVIIKIINYPLKYKVQYTELTHEAFIGLFGINHLKSKNFATTYAYKLGDTCPLSFYPELEICAYTVSEYIRGPILREYLKTATVDQLRSIYLQLFDALHEAYSKIRFTHYDLHLRNIIIKTENNKTYPVIIDFGTSYIRYHDWQILQENYGEDRPKASIAPRPYWVHDIIKLMLHTYTEISQEYVLNMTDYIIEGYQKQITELTFELRRLRAGGVIVTGRGMIPRTITIVQKEIDRKKSEIYWTEDRRKQRSDPKFYAPKEFLPYVKQILEFVFPGQDIDDKFVADQEIRNSWFPSPKRWNTDPLNTPEKFQEFINFADELLK